MKKMILLLLLLHALGLASCVKQRNCDCGLSGKFIYFEIPETIICRGYDCEVNAAFIPNGLTEESLLYGYYSRYNIVGSIPKEFKTKDTLNVSVCLKEENVKSGIHLAAGVAVVYKLKCIEKED